MNEVYILPISGSEDLVHPQNRGKYLIYRPLAGLAFVGNRAMADLAARACSDAWSIDLETSRAADAVAFLQKIGFLESDPPPPPVQAGGYQSLVFLLTNRCSLRCIYCYAAAGERPRQELSEAHAQTAADYFFAQAQANGLKEVEISFHGGGEPTFAWDLLKNITAYVRSKPLKSVISLTTNGLWSKAQCQWILANVDRIGISMDGAPETQNRQRPLASGKASAPVVMRNLAEMERRGIRYGIRMTATAPWPHLPEDVAYLCEHTGVALIQVEPAFNTGRGQHEEPRDSDWKAFSTAYLEAAEIARSHGRKLYYSAARAGQVTGAFCTSPYNALVVAPGGSLVACYEITHEDHPLAPVSILGKVVDGQVREDRPAREHLLQLLAERRASCKDCFCYYSCAGDCFAQVFQPGEQGHLAKTARCQLNRQITEQILLERIARGNGYWSAKEDPEYAPGKPVSALEEALYG